MLALVWVHQAMHLLAELGPAASVAPETLISKRKHKCRLSIDTGVTTRWRCEDLKVALPPRASMPRMVPKSSDIYTADKRVCTRRPMIPGSGSLLHLPPDGAICAIDLHSHSTQ